ncbi:Ger(x)C family spore germination protein [Mesobacillus jeotgali]|uniref:Ger(x)C family spore germination protein n=1 Tax=Mesobacillus jeotgali TaxID=129985 RepID=UPI0013150525|nr:Ger(x)C family spore germination protein [Mesobacillus jeotgali]
MRKKMNKLIIVILVLILSGCAEQKTLEKMGLLTTVGYDFTEDKQILATMVLLQIDPEAAQSSVILSAKSATSKGARNEADLKSPKKLQSGQLRVALFSEEVVRTGFINLADTLARDPSISDLTYLAVVEGSTNKLLNQKNEQFSDISQLIYKELDQNIKGEKIPSSTLQEVLHDFYAPGIDPILPTLKSNKGIVKITGMALIKNDKMVGKINAKEAFYLKLINDRYKAGAIELVIDKQDFDLEETPEGPDKLAVVLDTIHSKSEINLLSKENPQFELKVKLKTRLLEINQALDLKNPAELKKLEKKLNEKITADIEHLIKKARKSGADPFGFGEIYRKSVRHANLTTEKWHGMYPDSKVDVKIEFEVMRTGVVE